MRRGEIWWADLGSPSGSSPAKRRPVVVVQADAFNDSQIKTVMVAVVTSNQRLAAAPGNVAVSRRSSKLQQVFVVNVSQVATINKHSLSDRVSSLDAETMDRIDAGLRLSFGL